VPEDIAREAEASPEADNEQGKREDGSDAPRSQNVPARSLRLRKVLRRDRVVHSSAY
jgi:hypothetical protein